MRGITLKSALRLLLHKLGLTYTIQDEVLLITTPEQADSMLETKVYPVADLVLPAGATTEPGGQADFDALIDLLTSTVKPTCWDSVGGPGSVVPFENGMSIVVSQTQDVQEEIETVLEKLRKVKRDTGVAGLPARARRQRRSDGSQSMGGGMGGMGGGMGGMGGGMGGMGGGGMAGGTFGGTRAEPTRNQSSASPSASQQPDLLRGVQEMNKGFQGEQSEKLHKMYQGGKGGVGAGAAF
jgi:hypothetical protein